MPPKTLFIAYGNPDRQDDGVAWYILQRLAAVHGRQIEDYNLDFYDQLGNEPDFFFILQLIPELADLLVKYDRVCFIDAHVDDREGEILMQCLTPNYEPSTLSHHMTPQFLLDITQSYHRQSPAAILASVQGYKFSFIRSLTPQTQSLAEKVIDNLQHWYVTGHISPEFTK